MAKKKDPAVRIGVGYGLARGDRRSGVWRIWVHGDQVYVGRRDATDALKISLHSSGKWRYAHTTEVAAATDLDPKKVDRVVEKWDPPPDYSPGNKWAVSIVFETSELRAGGFDAVNDPGIRWITPPEPGYIVHVMVLIQHQPRQRDWPNIDCESWVVGTLPMKSGGVVKVVETVLPHTPELIQAQLLGSKVEFLLAIYDHLPEPYWEKKRGFIRTAMFMRGRANPVYFLDAVMESPLPSKEELLAIRENVALAGYGYAPTHHLDPFSGPRGWYSKQDN